MEQAIRIDQYETGPSERGDIVRNGALFLQAVVEVVKPANENQMQVSPATPDVRFVATVRSSLDR